MDAFAPEIERVMKPLYDSLRRKSVVVCTLHPSENSRCSMR